jgi:O-antigen ligase
MRYTTAEDYASAKAEFGLIWILYGLGGATMLVLVAKPALLAAAALGALVALAAYHLPEILLVLFLVVGPLKATEAGASLTGAAPAGFDLTVLTAAALVAAVCVSLWRWRREPFVVPTPALFFLALGVLLLVGVLASPDPEGGFDKALMFQTFSALAFLAPLTIVRTRATLYRTLALFVAVALAVALTAEEAERSESVLVLPGADNQIQVGLLLGLGFVSIVGYLWPASSGWLRLVWLPPAALTLVKLVSSGGRSALVGTLLACTVALACLIRAGRRDRLAALALVGVLAALLPAAWVTSSPAVKDRYLVTVQELRGGAGLDAGGADRSEVADAAVGVFSTHPLGAGTGGYPALTGYEWPHNVILELASELGVVGVAAFLALLIGIAVVLRRAARRPDLRREVVGAGSLLILPLTVAFSSFDLNGNRTLWFACGLALAATQLRR